MRTATKVKIVSRRYKARAQNPAFWLEKCFIRLQKYFAVPWGRTLLGTSFIVLCSGWTGCRPRATHLCTKSFRVDIKRRDEILGAVVSKTHNNSCEVALTTGELIAILGQEMRRGTWPHYLPADAHLISVHV